MHDEPKRVIIETTNTQQFPKKQHRTNQKVGKKHNQSAKPSNQTIKPKEPINQIIQKTKNRTKLPQSNTAQSKIALGFNKQRESPFRISSSSLHQRQ